MIDFLNYFSLSDKQKHNIVKNYLLGKQYFDYNDLRFEYWKRWKVIHTRVLPESMSIMRVYSTSDDLINKYKESEIFSEDIRIYFVDETYLKNNYIFICKDGKILSMFTVFGKVENVSKEGDYFVFKLKSGVVFKINEMGNVKFISQQE